jgi:hypothetical protein
MPKEMAGNTQHDRIVTVPRLVQNLFCDWLIGDLIIPNPGVSLN